MGYLCETCSINFQRNENLKKHYKTTKHLLKLSQNTTFKPTIYESNSLDLSEDKTRIQNLEKEVLELRYQIQAITSKNLIQNRIDCSDNRTINITTINATINLRAYGKENWDHLSEARIIEMMKKVHSSVPEIIKCLHFDANVPENHNIMIPNKKIARTQIYNGSKWITQPKKRTIEDLIEKALDKCDDVEEDFKKEVSQFLSNLWDGYSSSLRDKNTDKESKHIKKEIIEDIDCLILDNQSKKISPQIP
jgi:hypothetical protein